MVVNSVDHLRAVIAKCFPAYARIAQVPNQEDLVLQISWQLHSDSNLRSKTIELTIAREAVASYVSADDSNQHVADAHLAEAIREKLLEFDPDPKGAQKVVVSWLLGRLT